jgi:Putative outer membrane core complex of type IVb secretion/Toxin co-regulated pilus biosynthesis protein Q
MSDRRYRCIACAVAMALASSASEVQAADAPPSITTVAAPSAPVPGAPMPTPPMPSGSPPSPALPGANGLPSAPNLPSAGLQPAVGSPGRVAGGDTGLLAVPPGTDPKKATYDAAQTQLLPISPQEISDYRAARQQVEKATVENGAPENLARTVRTVDMTDGTPRSITLVSHYSTTLMLIGENGSPWPITQAIAPGDTIVQVTQPTGRTTSVVLTVKQPWMKTNLTVYLEGRAEPVVLFLQTSADPVDGLDTKVAVLVNGNPPGTAPAPVKNVAGIDSYMLNAVHFAPGDGWTAFKVEGDQQLPFKMSAWTDAAGKAAIVRLQGATLLSPAWDAQVSNADGDVRAYRYAERPLTFLVSDTDGVTYRVRGSAITEALAGRAKQHLDVSPLTSKAFDAAMPVSEKKSAGERLSLNGGRTARRSTSSSVPAATSKDQAMSVGAVASVPPAASSYSGTAGYTRVAATGDQLTANGVRGASALPPARSGEKPVYLVGSDAVVRYEAAHYEPGQPATDAKHTTSGSVSTMTRDDARSGSAFAQASGSQLQEPPSVARAEDPVTKTDGLFHYTVSGPSLRSNLERFARQAGWSRLVWKVDSDYRVPEGLTFQGADAITTVRQVLDRFPVRLEFYELNQVAVIVPRMPRDGFVGE